MEKKTTTESFKLYGENMLNKIKELIAEGNIRKITILDKNGRNWLISPCPLA